MASLRKLMGIIDAQVRMQDSGAAEENLNRRLPLGFKALQQKDQSLKPLKEPQLKRPNKTQASLRQGQGWKGKPGGGLTPLTQHSIWQIKNFWWQMQI